ncbi:MAG: hypothetical protein IK013_08285 [Bacteroidales bacterium]|nr:hypothetical protein [Bacteroidales bacterium]
MGSRRDIYESVKGRLAKELPWLRLIDLDKGQVGRGGQNYPVPLPAAFVRLGRIDWESRTGIQEGDTTLEVTLVLEHVQDTYDGAEAEEETLKELDHEEQLYAALEGYSSASHSGLNRRTSLPPEWGDRWVKLGSEWRCHVVQSKPRGQEATVESVKLKV